MEITNKRIQYSVSETSTTLGLTGEIMINSDKLVSQFNGTIKDNNGEYLGEFYFNEPMANKVNKSLNNINSDRIAEADALIASTVSAIKEGLTD